MKKRIISFLLVVVMATLALASCAYNPAKDDMNKYVTFDGEKFAAKLLDKTIKIEDGAFGVDEEGRWVKVDDAIFSLLVSDAGTTNLVTEGTPDKYSVYYYCYYVTYVDDKGNTQVFYADKMNDGSATKLQLGMSTLEGLDKKIADAVASVDITDRVYKTSSTKLVKDGDTVIVSYYKTEDKKDAEPVLTVDKIVIGKEGNEEWDALIGKATGNLLDVTFKKSFKLGEGKDETENTFIYSDITIEEIATSSSVKVKDGAKVYLSYKKTYAVKDENDKTTKAPDAVTVNYAETVIDKNNPFHALLIDKNANTTITVENKEGALNETIDGVEFNVTYSNVKVNWVVSEDAQPIEVKHTYTAKTEVAPVGSTTKVDLNGKELTYHIFPVYYVPVVSEYDAKVIVDTLLGTAIGVATENENDDDEEITVDEKVNSSGKVINLAAFADEKYKNGEELAKAIVEKLAELKTELNTIKTRSESDDDGVGLDAARKAYITAAKAVLNAEKPTDAQKAAVTDTKKEYLEVKAEYEKKEKEVDAQIDKLLGCEGDLKGEIVKEYKQANYDVLEQKYEEEIKKNLATAIFALLKDEYMVFKTEDKTPVLPEDYVREVYDRMINDLKYTFYTGSTTENSTSVKYYDKYNGDFNKFLLAEKDLKETDDIQKAKDLFWTDAREEVKELVMIYKLAEYYGDAVALDEEDEERIDTIIKNLEANEYYMAQLYSQWGISYSIRQIDEDTERDVEYAVLTNKIFNYLTEQKDTDNAEDNKVYFERVDYVFAENDK